MNSRRYFEIMPSEGEKKFTLPVNEHQVIFQRYLDECFVYNWLSDPGRP